MTSSPTKEQRLELIKSLDERVGRGESVMEMEIPGSVIADIKSYQAQYRKERRLRQYQESTEGITVAEMVEAQEASRQDMIRLGDLARTNPQALKAEIVKRMNRFQEKGDYTQ